MSREPGKSPELRGLAPPPLARLADASPRTSPPPARKPRRAPATTRSIAAVKKWGQVWAGRVRIRVRVSALRPVIQPQFAPTPSAPVLRLLPVAGLHSRSTSAPRPDPSKPDRTLHALQSQIETHRPERRRGAPAELVLPRNTS